MSLTVSHQMKKLGWPAYVSATFFLLLGFYSISSNGQHPFGAPVRNDSKESSVGKKTESLKKIRDSGNLVELDAQRRIRIIFPKDGVTEESLSLLKDIPDLDDLQISGIKLTDKNINSLSGLSQLQRLRLSGNSITDEGLKKLNFIMDNLYELELISQDSVHGDFLIRSSVNSKLNKLQFFAVPVEDDAFKTLRHYTNLHTLTIVDAPVNDAGLKNISGCIAIQELILQAGNFTDAGVASLSKLTNLRSFHGWSQRKPLTDECLRAFSKLPKLSNLALGNAPVTDDGLSYLRNSTQLESIMLSSPKITDRGIQNIKSLRSLKKIGLRFAQITDKGVEWLSEYFSELESIDLTGTLITNKSVDYLLRLKKLKDLILGHTLEKISKHEIERLRASKVGVSY